MGFPHGLRKTNPTLSQFSVPMKKNWYEETLYQDAQDPNAELEKYEALLEEQLLE